jgi:hypothetical protein
VTEHTGEFYKRRGKEMYERHTRPDAEPVERDDHPHCAISPAGFHRGRCVTAPEFATGGVVVGELDDDTIGLIAQSKEYMPPRRDVLADLKASRTHACYISGPMRGMPNLNHAAFDSAAEALKHDGWKVYNPAAKDREEGWDNDTDFATAIRADYEMLLKSEAIFMLPGWQASEGGRREANFARDLKLKFYELSEGEMGWGYQMFDPKDIGVEGIDQEARRLVYGERAATYGHPRGDFEIIAKMWSGILSPVLSDDITPEQVALCMSALKLARLAKSPDHHDSAVDAVGYLLCLRRLLEDPMEVGAWEEMVTSNRSSNTKNA